MLDQRHSPYRQHDIADPRRRKFRDVKAAFAAINRVKQLLIEDKPHSSTLSQATTLSSAMIRDEASSFTIGMNNITPPKHYHAAKKFPLSAAAERGSVGKPTSSRLPILWHGI